MFLRESCFAARMEALLPSVASFYYTSLNLRKEENPALLVRFRSPFSRSVQGAPCPRRKQEWRPREDKNHTTAEKTPLNWEEVNNFDLWDFFPYQILIFWENLSDEAPPRVCQDVIVFWMAAASEFAVIIGAKRRDSDWDLWFSIPVSVNYSMFPYRLYTGSIF